MDYFVSDMLYGHFYLGNQIGKYTDVELKSAAFSQDVFPMAFTKEGESMIGFVGRKNVTFLKYDKGSPSKSKETKVAHNMVLGHGRNLVQLGLLSLGPQALLLIPLTSRSSTRI